MRLSRKIVVWETSDGTWRAPAFFGAGTTASIVAVIRRFEGRNVSALLLTVHGQLGWTAEADGLTLVPVVVAGMTL